MEENDKSISQLTERTELTGNEMIPFAEGGMNGKIKSSMLKGKSAYQSAVEAGYSGTEAEFSALLAGLPEQAETVSELTEQVKDLYKHVMEDSYIAKDYCVAEWTDGDLSPESVATYGNPDILRDWHFFLLDTTDNAGKTTTPVGRLRKNNLLRFQDGTFSPVVGITEEQRAQCDVELYLDSDTTQKYCDAGAFDAEAFYNEYGISQKLYDALGNEVEHILRPWETTETKYTVGIGRSEKVYLLDGIMGNSGKVWKGIFKKPAIWDGIDVSAYPMAPTALSPCPVTTIDGKTRNFFYLYEGETNCKSSAGQSGLCTMFLNGRTYPRTVDVQQINLMNLARANNAVSTLPYPFAEGGYHLLNTYVTCLEVLYGTKYLHKADFFGSGISSNDTCNNEATWLSNGGIRYHAAGVETRTYKKWSEQGDIYYMNSTTPARVNFTTFVNLENPKEQCMESQMAVSFAMETGVAEGEEFEFYGATYWYKNIPGAKSLSEGDMNVRVYKRMSQTVSAFDSTGLATDFEIEAILRMSLFGGASLAGDIFAYCGGGCEAVGTCTDTASAAKNQPVTLYMEPDQTKWLRETGYTKNDLGTFDFESVYPKLTEVTNLGDGYAAKRQSYAPWKTLIGGSIGTGECFYAWDNKYWSTTLNQRVRLALRFRAAAYAASCAPRSLSANYAVSFTSRYSGGLAQAAIQEGAASLQA